MRSAREIHGGLSTRNGQSLPDTERDLSTSTSNTMYGVLGAFSRYRPAQYGIHAEDPKPWLRLDPREALGLAQPAAHLCPPTTHHQTHLVSSPRPPPPFYPCFQIFIRNDEDVPCLTTERTTHAFVSALLCFSSFLASCPPAQRWARYDLPTGPHLRSQAGLQDEQGQRKTLAATGVSGGYKEAFPLYSGRLNRLGLPYRSCKRATKRMEAPTPASMLHAGHCRGKVASA